MTVKAGFGDEKRVKSEVYNERHERRSNRESESC